MTFKLLLIGLGNLGFRYLEGIIQLENIEIYVNDINADAYSNVIKHLKYSNNDFSPSRIKNLSQIANAPLNFDLIIFATTAKGRSKLIQDTLNRIQTKYVIIEKVLTQSTSELDDLKFLFQQKSVTAWVNTPRRLMISWINIKKTLQNKSPINFNLTGKMWGLASNSIHFLDLMEWLTDSSIINIQLTTKNGLMYETKRKGFFDITGKIHGIYENGSKIQLVSNSTSNNLTIDIIDCDNKKLQINEAENYIVYHDLSSGFFEIDLQSKLIIKVLRQIILYSTSDLPDFSSSYTNHSYLFDALRSNLYFNKYDKLPIT